LGGAAAGEPALIAGAVEQISQQEEDIAAASADEAFAAGGGAPVREGAEA
jgi:hypothetical protein